MKIGLALGSGSSRGWSHIGIINELTRQGVVPEIVCGCSIGALVAAAYVSGNLEKLETWVRSLTKLQTARFFEINTSLNGFVNTERLHYFLDEHVASGNALIEDLPRQFATVATDLDSGREIWLSEGPVLEAVWSSISLPGLFPAIRNDNRWLVDGGLVNPVPVSLCRALGADVVIAVNLNGDIVGKHFRKPGSSSTSKLAHNNNKDQPPGIVDKITNLVTEYTSTIFLPGKPDDQAPSLFEAIAGSVNITQDRITRSRMAGDPPDILLSPKLSHIGLLEFYRADEAIQEGQECVRRMQAEIQYILSITE